MADTDPWLEGIEGDAAIDLIMSDEPIIRVIAGPGAGKTTCLKRRTRRLVDGEGRSPGKMFVGTFTRAIATDLKDSLGDAINVSTLHSHAFRLLRDNPAARQGHGLRFLLKYETDSMLYDLEHRIEGLGDIHSRRRSLRQLQADRARRTDLTDAAFAGAVTEWMIEHGCIEVGEVVHLVVEALEAHDIAPGHFDDVVVDEYQDLTASEQELVRLLWSGSGSLTVMGDDDQSIYSFRFNHPQGIHGFDGQIDSGVCHDVPFEENRRCGEEILNAANLMMAESGSTKPPMVAKSGIAGRVTQIHWQTLEDEIAGLAQHISAVNQSFLVLVPRRFIGYQLRDQIGDDASTSFSEEILEHVPAQEGFALASLLADPTDAAAVRSWLGFHSSVGMRSDRLNAAAIASVPNTTGLALLTGIASGAIQVSGSGRKAVGTRAHMAVDLLEQNLDPSAIIRLAFDPARAATIEADQRRAWAAADLESLRDAALVELQQSAEGDLAEVMASLRYRIATRAPLAEEEEKRVRIMTLHSAKGLEADRVVVAGLCDQFMPGTDSDAEIRSEQRRLLYVAVTRAKEELVLSWSRSVSFAEMQGNRGRIDKSFTNPAGDLRCITARCSLLPAGLKTPEPGHKWLQQGG